MTVTIPLTRGHVAIIDEADREIVSPYKWHASVHDQRIIYAATHAKTRKLGNSHTTMHRMIAGSPQGMFVDHIDGNTLNNSRSNLRVCTPAENARNRRVKMQNASSRFKGVYFCKFVKKWTAHVTRDGKHIRIGFFATDTEAALAYDAASIQVYGKFAATNASLFPELFQELLTASLET
jgi:hypothetical protein